LKVENVQEIILINQVRNGVTQSLKLLLGILIKRPLNIRSCGRFLRWGWSSTNV